MSGEAVCGHCGKPVRGSAFVDTTRLCHPDTGPDCYRLVTVYEHPMPCSCDGKLKSVPCRAVPADHLEVFRCLLNAGHAGPHRSRSVLWGEVHALAERLTALECEHE